MWAFFALAGVFIYVAETIVSVVNHLAAIRKLESFISGREMCEMLMHSMNTDWIITIKYQSNVLAYIYVF